MTTIERVVQMARQGISMDVMTMVLRSDGVSDSEISNAYNEIAAVSTTRVERGIIHIDME